MNLQPLGDRLIVEVLDEEEETVSGIVLPDTAKEKPQRGKVPEGDEIIFSRYGGTEIKLGTDEVLILRDSDVLARVLNIGGKRKRKLAGATA
jgi:chaperonin GroES